MAKATTTTAGVPHITLLAREIYAAATTERLGVGLKQWSLLGTVAQTGTVSQQELCENAHATPNTVVLWLNELEDAGLVTRLRDPEDRRKHNVRLTEAGTEAYARAEAAMTVIEDATLSGLTAEERAQLRALLAKALAHRRTVS